MVPSVKIPGDIKNFCLTGGDPRCHNAMMRIRYLRSDGIIVMAPYAILGWDLHSLISLV